MHSQDIISTLNRFWGEQSCVLLQPYDTEKGAGPMSPHTMLRAIGPEPCRRPTDGRDDDNVIAWNIRTFNIYRLYIRFCSSRSNGNCKYWRWSKVRYSHDEKTENNVVADTTLDVTIAGQQQLTNIDSFDGQA